MSTTPEAETGAWVSGFYGSGKSSFTKYLGYAFDQGRIVDGKPFAYALANQIVDTPTSQQLKTMAAKMDAAVILLDLANQTYGTDINNVSQILYIHTLRWAGYSYFCPPLAEFEILLEKENRFEEFRSVCRELRKREWEELKKAPIVAKKVAQAAAARMGYGENIDFNKDKFLETVDDLSEKTIEIARRKSGKNYVFFVIDEVGQYLASRPTAILDMDGLAKSIRNIGKGTAFVIATAQQTLTEDNPDAALNSTQLFKLKDRFPMSVTLESSDIEEICYRRLLNKSQEGISSLNALFDVKGQRLISRTKLEKAETYESKKLDQKSFIELYPFIPSHFKILLGLLTELSRATGGIGLRSAIKVVQDIMIGKDKALLGASVGQLVTVEYFYDELRLDIEQARKSLAESARKTIDAYMNADPLYAKVAKALVITDILKDLAATPKNVTALLQNGIDESIKEDQVAAVLKDMADKDIIPIAEDGAGAFHYLSHRQEELETERRNFRPYSTDKAGLLNEVYKEIFQRVKTVTGRNCPTSTVALSNFGDETILNAGGQVKLVMAFFDQGGHEQQVQACEEASRRDTAALFVVAERPADVESNVVEVLRSRRMKESHGNDSDPESREYASDQGAQASRLENTLRNALENSLRKGEFVYQGHIEAINPQGRDGFYGEVKTRLATLAESVYSKYGEAAEAVRTETAVRFLAMNPNKPIEQKYDPLHLMRIDAGTAKISEQPALLSVQSILLRESDVRGSKLFDTFALPPYGWSKDTLLYILAAMFWGGYIELNIAGAVYQTTNKAVEEAFKNPKAFANVGVKLRQARVSDDDLIKAGSFLAQQGVMFDGYTEDAIAKGINEFCQQNSKAVLDLINKVGQVSVYGSTELRALERHLDAMKFGTVPDFIASIQKDQTKLEASMTWLSSLKKADSNDVFETIAEVRAIQGALSSLPKDGIEPQIANLNKESAEINGLLQQSGFAEQLVKYKTFLSDFDTAKRIAVNRRKDALTKELRSIDLAVNQAVQRYTLTPDETNQVRSSFQSVSLPGTEELGVLTNALLSAKEAQKLIDEAVRTVVRRRTVVEKKPRTVHIKKTISDEAALQRLIDELIQLKTEINSISEINVTVD